MAKSFLDQYEAYKKKRQAEEEQAQQQAQKPKYNIPSTGTFAERYEAYKQQRMADERNNVNSPNQNPLQLANRRNDAIARGTKLRQEEAARAAKAEEMTKAKQADTQLHLDTVDRLTKQYMPSKGFEETVFKLLDIEMPEEKKPEPIPQVDINKKYGPVSELPKRGAAIASAGVSDAPFGFGKIVDLSGDGGSMSVRNSAMDEADRERMEQAERNRKDQEARDELDARIAKEQRAQLERKHTAALAKLYSGTLSSEEYAAQEALAGELADRLNGIDGADDVVNKPQNKPVNGWDYDANKAQDLRRVELEDELAQMYQLRSSGRSGMLPIQNYKKDTDIFPAYTGTAKLIGRPAITMGGEEYGTLYSITIQDDDGQWVNVPTIYDGKVHTENEAVAHYHEKGEHLGKYPSLSKAENEAQALSDAMGVYVQNRGVITSERERGWGFDSQKAQDVRRVEQEDEMANKYQLPSSKPAVSQEAVESSAKALSIEELQAKRVEAISDIAQYDKVLEHAPSPQNVEAYRNYIAAKVQKQAAEKAIQQIDQEIQAQQDNALVAELQAKYDAAPQADKGIALAALNAAKYKTEWSKSSDWDKVKVWLGDRVKQGILLFNQGYYATSKFALNVLGLEESGLSKQNRKDLQEVQQNISLQAERSPALANITGELLSSSVRTLPSVVLAVLTGGTSTATEAASAIASAGMPLGTQVLKATVDMLKSPLFINSWIDSFGNNYADETERKGRDPLSAAVNSIMKSTLDAIIEVGGGFETASGRPAGIMSAAQTAVEEGGEELWQGISGRAYDYSQSGKGAQTRLDDLVSWGNPEAIISGKQMIEEMAMGAAVGGLLGGGQQLALKGIDAAANAHQERNIDTTMGRIVESNAGPKAIVDFVRGNFREGSKAAELAAAMGAKPSVGDIGKLTRLAREELRQQIYQAANLDDKTALIGQARQLDELALGVSQQMAAAIDTAERKRMDLQDSEARDQKAYEIVQKELEGAANISEAIKGEVEAAPEKTGDILLAYELGKLGLPKDKLMSIKGMMDIGEETAGRVYGLGSQAWEAALPRKTKKAEQTRAQMPRAGEGNVSFDESVNKDIWNAAQRKQVEHDSAVAQILGLDVTFYQSSPNEEGHFTDVEGIYRAADGGIRIDINAGRRTQVLDDQGKIDWEQSKGDALMTLTMGHELTHHLIETNPELGREYIGVVLSELLDKNQDIQALIDGKVKRAAANKRTIGIEEAINEVVADGSEGILADETVMQKVAQQHPGLFTRIKDWILSYTKKLREAISGMELLRTESKALGDAGKGLIRYSEHITDLYSRMMSADLAARSGEKPAVSVKVREASPAVEAKNEVPRAAKAAVSEGAPDWAGNGITAGSADTVFTAENEEISFRYAVLPYDRLVTSMNTDMSINDAYPKELQPRDTERSASEDLVLDISRNLNFKRASSSGEVNSGAPLVGPDMVVEVGNHRAVGIMKAIESGGKAAQRYTQALKDGAEKFGIDPAEITDKSVLVRVRESGVDSRRRLAMDGNAPVTNAYSDTESAATDAAKINPGLLDMAEMGSGDIDTAANAKFVARFVSEVVPKTERGRMVDSEGKLSRTGEARIRNALFQLAYGDGYLTEQLAEATDTESRNMIKAMTAIAPRLASMNADMKRGLLHDLDVGGEIAESYRTVLRQKLAGVSVEAYLNQTTMLEDVSAAQRLLLEMFVENKRSAVKMTEALDSILDALEAQGDPRQQGLLGDAGKPIVEGVMGEGLRNFRQGLEEKRVASERYSERETRLFIKAISQDDISPETLENNIRLVASMSPVTEMQGNEFQITREIDEIVEFFKSVGGSVENELLGDVLLTKRGIKDSRSHGYSDKKKMAFIAVPEVIMHGKLVDYQKRFKNRSYDTFTFAAPVRVKDGSFAGDYYQGVIVKRYSNSQPFYIHEIVTQEKSDVRSTGPMSKNDTASGPSDSSIFSLLQKIQDVKHDLFYDVTKIKDITTSFAAKYGENPKYRDQSNVSLQSIPAADSDSQDRFSERDYAPPLYSKMAQEIEAYKGDKMGADSVVKYLQGRGVKSDEIRWSGIVPFLQGKKSVSKAELLEFARGSWLKVVDVAKEDPNLDAILRQNAENENGARGYTLPEEAGMEQMYDDRKYVGYKLKGGDNYRELLFTAPDLPGSFQSQHWNEKNVLAHTRLQDFQTPDGKPVLFIEEVQSDWHEKGREEGYYHAIGDVTIEQYKPLEYIQDSGIESTVVKDSSGNIVANINRGKAKETGDVIQYVAILAPWLNQESGTQRFQTEQAALDYIKSQRSAGVAPAPFTTTWHEYVLKRVLRMAAEGGYDYVGWTTGKMQADRYNLEKQIDHISIAKTGSEKYIVDIYDKSKSNIFSEEKVTPIRLSEVVGKEVARHVIEKAEQNNGRMTNIPGDGLTMGGDGMKAFYDIGGKSSQNIPRFLNKYGAQWGAKISTIDMQGAENTYQVPAIEVTDAMKESVLYEGQVMYSERQRDMLSKREVLAGAFDQVAQSDGEKRQLNEYKKLIRSLNRFEREASELRTLNTEERRKRGEADKGLIASRAAQISEIEERIDAADRRLLRMQNAAPLRNILKRESDRIYTRAQEQKKEKLDQWRQAREDNAEHTSLINGISKTVMAMQKWINEPNTKTGNYVPDLLVMPLGKMLEGIDIQSKRALNSGDRTSADKAFLAGMDAMYSTLEGYSKDLSKEDGSVNFYLDLPSNMLETMNGLIASMKELVETGGPQGYIINQMSNEQLSVLEETLTTLKTAIRTINATHVNSVFEHVNEAAEDNISEVEGLRKKGRNSQVMKFFNWLNATPVYAFERMGKAAKSFFEAMQDGADKLAYHVKNEVDFAKSAFSGKEVRDWNDEVKTFNVKGRQLQIPVSTMMSIYLLSKRNQAMGHIMGAGIRIANFKQGTQTIQQKGVVVNDTALLEQIEAALTDRQKAVANALQRRMSTVGARLGNEVSMKRFGTRMFTEPNYFPIEVDNTELSNPKDDDNGRKSTMFSLLNMSATKQLTKKANNRLVARDIFTVYADHMSDMARYNAMALPILDMIKWYNYRNVQKDETGRVTDIRSTKGAFLDSFGDGANTYIRRMLENANGADKQSSADRIGNKFLGKYNRAVIAANLRVALLQPTAYMKAAMVINPISMGTGLIKSVAHLKANIAEMEANSGIAQWKQMGFYDLNVSNTVQELIKRDEGVIDKLSEKAMWLPGFMDRITWASLWQATKDDVSRKMPKMKGDAFMEQVKKSFRDMVYRTQVVDSVLTRSEFMRQSSFAAKSMSSFMSEGTQAYNLAMNAVHKLTDEVNRGTNIAGAWKKHGGTVARTVATYTAVAAVTALVEAISDAYRDDDEITPFIEKVQEAYTGNLFNNLLPINIPIVSDMIEAGKRLAKELGADTYGFSETSALTAGFDYLTDFVKQFKSWQEKQGDGGYQVYGWTYKILQSLSTFTGMPMANLSREIVTAWNAYAKVADPGNVIKTYERKGDAYDALYKAIELQDEERRKKVLNLLEERGDTQKDIDKGYWDARSRATGEKKYETWVAGIRTGENLRKIMEDYTAHGVTAQTLGGEITGNFKDEYIGLVNSGRISEAAALKGRLLNAYVLLGYKRDDKNKDIDKWVEEAKKNKK